MSVVDRCVCFDVPFSELKRYADVHGGGVDALRERYGCGRGCALCVPYIRRMLETGETRIPLMDGTDQDSPDLPRE